MFSKTSAPIAAPTPPPPTRAPALGNNSARSVLGADLRITGEFISSGTVEIQGEIDGNITANGLIIGHEGRVKGSITASSVEVKGQFSGKVACDIITLRSTAMVTADIMTTGIVIESGAQIEGRFLAPKG